MRKWSGVSAPKAVLVVLALTAAGALAVSVSTSTAAYGPYTDDWDGTANLRSIAADSSTQVELVHTPSAYSSVSPNETIAFVLSPNGSYRPSESTRVTDFVRKGGTLVVADDYGPHANDLLRQLGASARLDGRPVYDVRSNYRSSAMPIATPVADHTFVAGVESVTLNYGTVVESREATPLLNTSENAFVDADRNGELGPNETLETYTVATVERVGEGQVVVVGDASVFINTMVDQAGNEAFVRALLSGRETLVLDTSHGADLPPIVLAVVAVRRLPLLQFGLGTIAIGALAVWSRHPPLNEDRVRGVFGAVRRRWNDDSTPGDAQTTTSELTNHLEREHPDWDPERVERVVDAMERRRSR